MEHLSPALSCLSLFVSAFLSLFPLCNFSSCLARSFVQLGCGYWRGRFRKWICQYLELKLACTLLTSVPSLAFLLGTVLTVMAGGLCQSKGCLHLFSGTTLGKVPRFHSQHFCLQATGLSWSHRTAVSCGTVNIRDSHEARKAMSTMWHFFPNSWTLRRGHSIMWTWCMSTDALYGP